MGPNHVTCDHCATLERELAETRKMLLTERGNHATALVSRDALRFVDPGRGPRQARVKTEPSARELAHAGGRPWCRSERHVPECDEATAAIETALAARIKAKP